MNDDVRRAIGGRLKEFRQSLGMTQIDFAKTLQAKRQSVSAWELGKSMPRGEDWLKLGQLGMSLDYVVLNIRNVPASNYARGFVASKECASCTLVKSPQPI